MSMQILPIKQVEKVWGRDTLPQPFEAPEGERIGEIWFEPPAMLDTILAKYLFTSEKLSVQVHPDDARAPQGSRGKEECWLVLDAEPGAQLAIGFDEPIDADTMRQAAEDGSIEQRLMWHDVRAGDFFYLPAGTVHAIGGGLSLVEIQQNSDLTYRLYDYGRPRELHLEDGVAVADGGRYAEKWHRHIHADTNERLVDGPHFQLDQCIGTPDASMKSSYARPVAVMVLSGKATMDGQSIRPGECGVADNLERLEAEPGSRLLLFAEAG